MRNKTSQSEIPPQYRPGVLVSPNARDTKLYDRISSLILEAAQYVGPGTTKPIGAKGADSTLARNKASSKVDRE